MFKVALPVAAGARQQQKYRRVFLSECIDFHRSMPFKKAPFAFSSVSSDSS